jgi:DNA-binding GntR family transcriptional regulator
LVADGLATDQPRKGVVVATIDLADLLEIHEIREMTEALSARLCAERVDAHGVRILREIVDKQKKCVADDDAQGYFETNNAFHDAIGSFAKNPRLKDILSSLEGQMRIGLRKVSLDGEQRRDGIVEHSLIVDAIERRDGDEAERLMRQHIAQTKERLARMLREEVALNAA